MLVYFQTIHPIKYDQIEDRHIWFDDIRKCRRRKQHIRWETTPIARIFTMNDELQILKYKATISRVTTLISQKGLLLLDAFRSFDSNRDGRLNCSELYGGLTWLGLDVTPADIYDIVRSCDKHGTGELVYSEFARLFRDPHQPVDVLGLGLGAGSGIGIGGGSGGAFDLKVEVVPPRPIRELYEDHKVKPPVPEYESLEAAAKLSFRQPEPYIQGNEQEGERREGGQIKGQG